MRLLRDSAAPPEEAAVLAAAAHLDLTELEIYGAREPARERRS